MRDMLVTTPPVAKPCDQCGRWILTGQAEGIRATVDMTRLEAWQRIQATLLGIPIYWLTRLGLVYLDESRAQSADRHPVVPEHRCQLAWPSQVVTEVGTPSRIVQDRPPY